MNPSYKHITLKHLLINNHKMIGLQFHADKVIQALVKELPDPKWSKEFDMVYIKNIKGHLDLIFDKFRGVAWVNCNFFFKDRVINPSNESVNTSWFLNRKTVKNYRVCPENYLQKLELKRYANNTIRNYVSAFEAFINYYDGIELIAIGEQEIRFYLQELIQQNRSNSYINLAINSIKFYYEIVLGMPNRFYAIERPRKQKQLPQVLSKEEVL